MPTDLADRVIEAAMAYVRGRAIDRPRTAKSLAYDLEAVLTGSLLALREAQAPIADIHRVNKALILIVDARDIGAINQL